MRLGLYVGLVRMVDDWLGLCQACVEKRTKRELAPVGILSINSGKRRLCPTYWPSLVDWRSVGVVVGTYFIYVSYNLAWAAGGL